MYCLSAFALTFPLLCFRCFCSFHFSSFHCASRRSSSSSPSLRFRKLSLLPPLPGGNLAAESPDLLLAPLHQGCCPHPARPRLQDYQHCLQMGAAQVGAVPPLHLQMHCPLLIMPAEFVSQTPTEMRQHLSSPRHIQRPLQCGRRNAHSGTTTHPCVTRPRASLLVFAPLV